MKISETKGRVKPPRVVLKETITMIIIIEGIDRVGKTTLANKLSEQFNIPIYKQERLGGNEVQLNQIRSGKNLAINNMLVNYTRAKTLVDFWNWTGYNENIIMDRFHWTEAVYGLVDRGSVEPMNLMKEIENDMLKRKDKYFIIHVMPVDIKWSNRQHGSDLSRHQKEFDKLYHESKLNKYRCTYYSYDMCISEVERRLNNVKAK